MIFNATLRRCHLYEGGKKQKKAFRSEVSFLRLRGELKFNLFFQSEPFGCKYHIPRRVVNKRGRRWCWSHRGLFSEIYKLVKMIGEMSFWGTFEELNREGFWRRLVSWKNLLSNRFSELVVFLTTESSFSNYCSRLVNEQEFSIYDINWVDHLAPSISCTETIRDR